MPYKDPERQRQVASEWANRRRREWLDAQQCHRCGADGTATTLHVFGAPSNAYTTTRERRDALMASATVLCDGCVAEDRRARAEASRQRRNERRRIPPEQQRRVGRKPGPKVEKAVTPKPRRAPKVAAAEADAPRTRQPRKATVPTPSSLADQLAEEQRREERRRWREEQRAAWRSNTEPTEVCT